MSIDTTPTGPARHSGTADTENKRRKLRIARRRATGLLVLSAVVYALATRYGGLHGSLEWVAAFAEAAMVGALADWYAVVALFRHPLGLRRMPHTAIIPRNKDRIADNLGEFVQGEFFSPERVAAVVDAINPALLTAEWLRNEANAARTAAWVRNVVRMTGGALNESEVRAYLRHAASRQVLQTDLAGLAGNALASLTRSGRHQAVLDLFLQYAARQLQRPEAQDALNTLLAEKLPLYFSRLKSWAGTKGGEFTARTLAELIDEVNQDPGHPVRGHFDAWVRELIGKLRTDPAYRYRIEQFTQKIAGHPALSQYVDEVLNEWRVAIARDLDSEDSRFEAFLARQIVRFGNVLEQDEDMRAWMNDRARRHAPRLVDRYRHRLGQFIAGKMKEWNETELVDKLELNIGADLQYIRINGALVGGVVGLLIHAVSRYL